MPLASSMVTFLTCSTHSPLLYLFSRGQRRPRKDSRNLCLNFGNCFNEVHRISIVFGGTSDDTQHAATKNGLTRRKIEFRKVGWLHSDTAITLVATWSHLRTPEELTKRNNVHFHGSALTGNAEVLDYGLHLKRHNSFLKVLDGRHLYCRDPHRGFGISRTCQER